MSRLKTIPFIRHMHIRPRLFIAGFVGCVLFALLPETLRITGPLRKVVIAHCIGTFCFNTIIIALMVNVSSQLF